MRPQSIGGRSPRPALQWLAATGVTALLTVLMLLLHADSTAAGMIYLVLVVWLATLAGLRLSLYVAAGSALLFDYFFLEPRYSFNLTGLGQWLALAAFFVCCLIVVRVAEHGRRQTQQSNQRRADVERLYSLSQAMMLHGDAEGLVREIPLLIERNFALDAVLLCVRDPSAPHGNAIYSSAPGPSLSTSFDTIRKTLQSQSSAWDTPAELPDGFSSLNLVFGMKNVGLLAWKPDTLSREVAASIAAQVAIALTRSLAMEQSARLEAARASDRLRTALIDSLTHELRTPLTAIRAAATTLLDGPGRASSRYVPTALDIETRDELASIIDEESARLDTLIGQAIEMAQIDSGNIRVQLAPVEVRPMLEQALEGSRDQLTHRRVSLDAEELPEPLWFDARLISRVLRHLLENAGRYTPPGSAITLRCRREPDTLLFEVEDNGPGIDSADLPLIFDKFYRGKHKTKAAKGSGMGLAIARAMITAHHGSITAQSQPGEGTRFEIRIPVVEKTPAAPEADLGYDPAE